VARVILHVDLDQFLAAVEVLRRPELRGRPVVVGGSGDPTQRGVVSTASYEARRFGITSGMPLRTAARRCPDAVFLPVDGPVYHAASDRVMATIRALAPTVEVAGWDEAFLEVETADPVGFARELQGAVLARTGLSCSVGIGQNKLQAKIASGMDKPGGVFVLTGDNWFEVMGMRRTEALWGVGRKTAGRLARLGIRTVADLAGADVEALAAAFGPNIGPWLRALARGHGSDRLHPEPHVPRSTSRETTFQRDLAHPDDVRTEVRRLARQVADDVARLERPATRVVVKVRFAPFLTSTHGVAVGPPSMDAARIEEAALAALERFEMDRPVRLLGVRAELTPTAEVPLPGETLPLGGATPEGP
jgi:nucleotidyltransferase/DNA polymerase involved in DNA repair